LNPIYAVMESAHRWLILSGIAFLAGTFGAMMMLAYVWPQWLIRVWLIGWLLAAGVLLVRALLDWKARVEAGLLAEEKRSERRVVSEEQ
jgi:hypothetical protein